MGSSCDAVGVACGGPWTRATASMAGWCMARLKLNDELEHRILQFIQAGNYVETACAASGITEATYYNWLRWGRIVEEKYGETLDPEVDDKPDDVTDTEWRCWLFLRRAKVATAEAEAYAVAIVRKHMPDQWTAAMTFLERRHPGRWKRREVIESGEGEGLNDARIREEALLQNPDAVKLLHDALELAARGELPSGDDEVIDTTAEEIG